MNAIELTNLTKKFGDFTAVDHLNLNIKKGELFSLLGVNGAGKTVTIKMLSCLIKPTSGDAVLLGDSVKKTPGCIKANINISPQEIAVASNLTVTENLELIAGLYGMDRKKAKKRTTEMISQFGLEDVRKKSAKKLSGGTKQRLSIAMALITDPQILFLDEPTVGLDVFARHELWKSIKALKGKTTIILTTHYLEEVEELSDRVGVMAKGSLKAVGTVKELTKQTKTKKLEDAFITLLGGKA